MRFLTPGLLSISRITSLAELTYYISGSSEPASERFESEAAFKKFAGRDLYVENESGKKTRLITSLKQALDVAKVGKGRLVLYVPFLNNDDFELRKETSELERYIHKDASSLQVQTTLSIARDETFANEYGTLKLVNEGRGVILCMMHDIKFTIEIAFRIDGLVKSSTVLLMNVTQSRLDEADAKFIAWFANLLQDAITHPEKHKTVPAGVLWEIAGLAKVVPIASTKECTPGAKKKCAELGIHLVMPDGSGFAATLHKSPQHKHGVFALSLSERICGVGGRETERGARARANEYRSNYDMQLYDSFAGRLRRHGAGVLPSTPSDKCHPWPFPPPSTQLSSHNIRGHLQGHADALGGEDGSTLLRTVQHGGHGNAR